MDALPEFIPNLEKQKLLPELMSITMKPTKTKSILVTFVVILIPKLIIYWLISIIFIKD